jgi:uncharacterized membrane protein YqjE
MGSPDSSRGWLSLLLDAAMQLGSQTLRERWAELNLRWAQEKVDILQTLLRAAIALMLLGLGALLLVAWVVLAFWETHGLLIMASLGAILLAAGGWMLDRLRWQLQLPDRSA